MAVSMNSNGKKTVVMLAAGDFTYPYVDPRIYKEAKSLIERGYEVSVICWHKHGKNMPEAQEYNGIKVYRIFQNIPHHTPPLLWRLPFYMLYVFKSVGRSLKLNPDIIHCHDLDTLIIGVILKTLIEKPLVFDVHEDLAGVFEGAYSNMVGRLARLYEKILIKMVDKVIVAVTPFVNIMEKHYGVNPVVVMNLPNLNDFHPEIDSSPIIRKYTLENKIIISHIGTAGGKRGIYETLEALQYLNIDNIRYFIIGRATNEERNRIREATRRFNLEDKVVFLPDGVEYKDIPMYYRVSNIVMVLLYPIHNYVMSLPTKLFEGMAVGIPVLAGNLDYICSMVTKYEVGLCADAKNPVEIAEKLKALISNKKLRLRMGRNGLKAVRERFNWDESAKRLIRIYEGILQQK